MGRPRTCNFDRICFSRLLFLQLAKKYIEVGMNVNDGDYMTKWWDED